jgi:ornithine carbamoyltransferase
MNWELHGSCDQWINGKSPLIIGLGHYSKSRCLNVRIFLVRKFTYVGDETMKINAWMTMGAIMGSHVVVQRQAGITRSRASASSAQRDCRKNRGQNRGVTDPEVAAKDTSVLSTPMFGCQWEIQRSSALPR